MVLPPGGTRGDAPQQAGPLPNVGGQRSGHNIYLLDGAKVTDELFNNLAINPSVDSIQEFRIQKSMYPAEFGGKAGSANVDLALAKTWPLRGTSVLELRWEIFNVFNRANLDVPNRIFGSPDFGRVSSAKNPREMQFGARVVF